MESLISVIVPIYKVEEYLDRCVNSIVNQTYKNLEIILVNDGSPDNCPQMCDEWAKKDNRIKVIHKKNGGLSDARNAGINVAAGGIISFIDSDDWIELDMFEKMINCMQEDSSDVVSCGVNWVTEDGKSLKCVSVEKNEILDVVSCMHEIINDNKLKQHVWNKIYKTEIIKHIAFEKGKYHEDAFWSYQVFGRVNRVSLMRDAFYNYVQRNNSIMGNGYSSRRLDGLDALKKTMCLCKELFPRSL